MSNDHLTIRRRPRALGLAALAIVLLGAACGGDDTERADGNGNGTTTTVAPGPAPAAPSSTPAGTTPEEDRALAEAALLGEGDLDGWSVGPPEMAFPTDVVTARTVPACADAAETVFTGGTEHGEGVSGVLVRDADVLFTYVVVFPSEADAAAMVEATADPSFDECWAGFNAAAVPGLIGADGATYESADPPDLSIEADQVDVEYLTGSIDMDGIALSDSCVCVFARTGRGVVAVHSTAPVFDPEARSDAVQVAVDKLSETLSS